MSRFIVTGGAGLIGSNIVEKLNNRGETDITVVDHLNHPGKQRNLDRLKFTRYVVRGVPQSVPQRGGGGGRRRLPPWCV